MDQSLQTTPSGLSRKSIIVRLRGRNCQIFRDMLLRQQIDGAVEGAGRRHPEGPGHVDNGPFAGVTWQVTAALMLTGAAYYDHMSNAAIGNGELGSGSRYTFVALAEYALSKHTEAVRGRFRQGRCCLGRIAGQEQPTTGCTPVCARFRSSKHVRPLTD